MKCKYYVGIDEAGRGPLAGPVSVGVAKVPADFDWERELPGVNDSKKLTPQKRAVVFLEAKKLRHVGRIDFAVGMVGPSFIDKQGILTYQRERLWSVRMKGHNIKIVLERCHYCNREF